jgi:hypothetical protein
MKKSLLLWIFALLITVSTAVYQRLTGPTYPISGNIKINDVSIEYKLSRSHGGRSDHEVSISAENSNLNGTLYYKRYKTDDAWTKVEMENHDGKLRAFLPHQPPAGKLEYFLSVNYDKQDTKIPKDRSVIIRFKGDVPLIILIPHIIAMFLSMLLSNRTGLEFFNKGSNLVRLTYWTIASLVVGGFILGPLTQLYAFGELWTGFPFGHDLTDNKTLIALIGWLTALFMYKKSINAKKWALFAALLLIIVYLIPHSMMGSELDYNEIDKSRSGIENLVK